MYSPIFFIPITVAVREEGTLVFFILRIDGVERSIFKNPVAAFACRFCGKALTLKFLAYMITDFGLYNAVDVLHGYAAVADHLV